MIKFLAVSDFRCGHEANGESCISERDAQKLNAIASVSTRGVRFIADLGDSLDKQLSPENGAEVFKTIFYNYDRLVNVYSVLGERDLILTREKYLELNDYSLSYRAFDHSDYRCIFLDCCVEDADGNVHFEIDDEQFLWLSRLLGKGHRSSIIFTHAPILVSSPEDEDKTIRNAAKLRELIEKSGKVVLVVSGHLDHGDFVVSNEVPYLTLAPMCGDEATFAEIMVSSRGIEVTGYGAQSSHTARKELEVTPKKSFVGELKNIFKRK